jgi:anti-sigma factor RsiW
MNHQEAKDLFTNYLDGDMADAQRTELEAHLSACTECKEEWQTFKKLMSEVSGLMNLAPPRDVVRAVEKKIHRRSRGKFFGRPKGSSIQFGLISFILVLLFMLGYLLLTAVNEIVFIDSDNPGKSPASNVSADD